MLRYRPRPWSEADSVSIGLNMAKMLNSSWQLDLAREQVRARLSPELYSNLFPDDLPLEHPVAEAVAGPARAVSSDAARLLPAPESRGRELDPTLDALLPGDCFPCTDATSAGGEPSSRSFDEESDFALGSNNWVVSGSYTASGKPLVSNDPHLGHSIPSVWYMIHLEAPGLNVSGVSLPGSPGVIIGHNDRIAWGMTNTGPDVQDLYIEKFNPANPNQYVHNGQWVEAETRDEVIKVRGEKDYQLSVRTTRHGPVISDEGGRALALSWTALQPHALQFPFLAINQARNWRDFTQALRQFTGPEQNMVYADVDGNIGYYAPAWVPVRRQGDGSVPVPGDTDAYEWMGYIPFEDLPHAYNPPGRLIATANSRVIPKDYPYFFTHAWTAPFRTARIFDLLEAGTPSPPCAAGRAACFTVDDMLKIDGDIHPLDEVWLAGALVRAASVRPPNGRDAREAVDLLRHWNGEATSDSPVPLICHDTLIALRERLLDPKVGADMARRSWSLSTGFVQKVIDQQLTRWLPPGDADFNATLMASLDEGVRRIEKRLPDRDVPAWRCGDTIPLIFHHPLDSVPLVGRLFDVGPYPQAGTADSIKATTPNSGPSMRMVADLSDWDASVQNLTLGESGQLASPYYQDQFHAWYTVHSFPMLFSGQAVEHGAAHRLTLEPSRQ